FKAVGSVSTTSAIRWSHYEAGIGKKLPFSIGKQWQLLSMMVAFGSRFAAPFLIVRHQQLIFCI
uniref:Cytochrome c oxidase subunit 7C, mitochondrial n=1 Tax=Podarcis muralis TaxID=64176 RepID=A0A670JWA8_PODMU